MISKTQGSTASIALNSGTKCRDVVTGGETSSGAGIWPPCWRHSKIRAFSMALRENASGSRWFGSNCAVKVSSALSI